MFSIYIYGAAQSCVLAKCPSTDKSTTTNLQHDILSGLLESLAQPIGGNQPMSFAHRRRVMSSYSDGSKDK